VRSCQKLKGSPGNVPIEISSRFPSPSPSASPLSTASKAAGSASSKLRSLSSEAINCCP
jgi:hypothetical protein